MIKVDKLNKYYNKGKRNEIHVINNTSFELPDTGLISFLGQSGSGKTTLLNVLGGLDSASGSIKYEDKSFNRYDMKKIDKYRSENIGYVFQNYKLLPNETVYENLRLALELVGVTDKEEVDKRIEYTLTAVNMFKYRKKKAYALSGGQQQRVSIARALVKNSKIIIADEPTGNLDSQNTIEVMNILKEISKKALVLLVTHDSNIANFYSDYIFELSDGKIINEKVTDGNTTLKKDVHGTIYLKDLYQNSQVINVGNVDVYSDDENFNVNFRIIIKNGTVYVDSNKNLKLLQESNIKVLDESYHDVIKETPSIDYDTSWYNKGENKKNYFKKLIYDLRYGLFRFSNVNRKGKFLHFSLFLIGVVLAFSIVALITATTIDVSKFSYNENYSSFLDNTHKNSIYQVAQEAYDMGYIDNILSPKEVTCFYNTNTSFSEKLRIEEKTKLLPYHKNKVDISVGKHPENDGEVVLSNTIADLIIKKSSADISYKNILGNKIRFDSTRDGFSYECTIVGISKNDQNFNYLNVGNFYRAFFDMIHNNTNIVRSAQFETDIDGNKLYDIIIGEDVDLESDEYQLLVNIDDYSGMDLATIMMKYPLPFSMKIKDIRYKVVGFFKYKYKIENKTYITNKEYINHNFFGRNGYFTDTEISLLEGRMPQKDEEIIVPYTTGLSIGDTKDKKEVVGIYTGSSLAMLYSSLCTQNVAVLNKYNKELVFDVLEKKPLEDFVEQFGYEVHDNLKAQALVELKVSKTTIILMESLFVVLFVVAIIFIYFIMRSKMISDIYTIGVHRSLGFSKRKIYKTYFIDSIYLTLFTSLLGYAVIILIYNLLADMIYPISTYNILWGGEYYILLGIVALFIAMVTFGMLPIMRLLKKTPTEICMYYDI